MGLTQLMPETCHDYGITDPYDIRQNILGGAREFSEDLGRYRDRDVNTQVTLALAAYNAGPGAVKRAGGVPQNGETPPYIRHVLATYSELVAKGYR
jgi:soluble lytic murein transglycosylase-like protein